MGAGRQREFDTEAALDAAVTVFWTNGFSGASLSDLTTAMGINKPSLYAAFGNKEALFVRALEHYVDKYGSPHIAELQAPGRSLHSRISAFLKAITRMLCDPSLPGGCFVAETTSEAGGHCLPASALSAISSINSKSRDFFFDFFRHEISVGNLGDDVSEDVLTDYLLTLQYGLAVMARKGEKRTSLDKVVDYAVTKFE